ncbi:ProQ/FinO family protein [Aggregatibacter actinomycetemcomitans]|uniref:ProQ/FinO family protein n=1 Tax=Aggregatibacter actinomycetemcomitans TaxID=714 RepID=UPI00077E6930|nr:ProQ/FinO family protein [Aggregatibacter actinomycetemcomitans]KYK72380.1 hypothetical protein SA3096_10320 [Aggregatibacter actinomycetemcomitans serotype e str. SA3096]TYA25168.1 hypothetical protein FXE05_05965 [Aggregatibacter actinomycetemcomitans]TYA28576.1 hypothetical protein FXB96_08730 [Aggregatibacter actinomycetemcomitans]TYA36280.1 hypothetical protein FXE06_08800 [Aggregatibacter actinomycetemcomitans]TYA42602.1 hypothetical protein FXB70_08525 [Aggregatibacter actinomycetemc
MKKFSQYKNAEALAQARKENRALLEGFFGKVIDYENPKPLKIGFLDDIANEAKRLNLPFTKTFFRKSIKEYTMRINYLKALSKGGARYNIEGEPCGEISELEINNAKDRIAVIRKKKNKNKNC